MEITEIWEPYFANNLCKIGNDDKIKGNVYIHIRLGSDQEKCIQSLYKPDAYMVY